MITLGESLKSQEHIFWNTTNVDEKHLSMTFEGLRIPYSEFPNKLKNIGALNAGLCEFYYSEFTFNKECNSGELVMAPIP